MKPILSLCIEGESDVEKNVNEKKGVGLKICKGVQI